MNKVYDMICSNEKKNLAIVDEYTKVSYEELRTFCEEVQIYNSNLQKGDSVIIYAKKNTRYICTMVAMLSMGVAYLPLDKHTPVEKVREYQKKLNSKIVFVDCHYGIENEILIEELGKKQNERERRVPLREEVEEDSLAYLICTSGSSGEPKMVMIEHHSLLNLVQSLHDAFYKDISVERQLHIAVVASLSFDASVKQIYYALCYGHILYVCDDKDKILGRKFKNFLQKNHIDVIDCTPTLISSIYADKKSNTIQCLKVAICGGEKILTRHVNEAKKTFNSGIQLVNVYGPTECCVDATYYKIPMNTNTNLELNDDIPIGRALNNVVLRLEEGELIIGGACVGRGYYGVKDQGGYFTNAKGERFYRTGDICCEKNGEYYLLSRADGQDKINGFRVEPSTVDYELAKVSGIEYSVTVISENMGRKMLITFICSTLERGEVLAYIKEHLPDYYRPKYLFFIKEKLVQNKNGKIDKKYYKELCNKKLKELYNSEKHN